MPLQDWQRTIMLETISEISPSKTRPGMGNGAIDSSEQYIPSLRRVTDCFVSFPARPEPSIRDFSPFMFKRKQVGSIVEIESRVYRYTSYCRHYVRVEYKEVQQDKKNRNSTPTCKYDHHRVFSKLKTGLSILFLPYSLDVPEQFLSLGWRTKARFGLRLEAGVIALSIDGLMAFRTDYLIGIAGMGWFEPKDDANLWSIRPGKLLALAGLSRRNGKLPDKWTDRDRKLSSMKLLEREGRGE